MILLSLRYLFRPCPKFSLQITPSTKLHAVSAKEVEAMMLKNVHSLNNQRKVSERNITLQPNKYITESVRKRSIATLNSLRIATHP